MYVTNSSMPCKQESPFKYRTHDSNRMSAAKNPYDLIVVGAGLSGLYVAVEWLKKNPSKSCCLLEKYGYTGGRVVTYHTYVPGRGKLHWEGGAGRIANHHHRVRRLLTRYGLTFAPLSGSWGFSYPLLPSPFTPLTDLYLPPLAQLSPRLLGQTTLSTLLRKVYGSARTKAYLATFPYYAEFHSLRADLALASLQSDLHSPAGFGVCAEGLSALTDALTREFLLRGGVLQQRCTVERVCYTERPLCLTVSERASKDADPITRHEYSLRVVLALDASSLHHIQGVSHLPVLRHLKMIPLLRIYAVFPVHQGKSWFSDISTTVLDSPLRFFIPIQPDKGVVMISYTEGPTAEYWMTMSPDQRQREVLAEARRVFSPRTIPDPLFFHSHPWKTGCTYWQPGTYDPVKESERSIQPFPGHPLYLSSESFAVMQCWMESALIQAEAVLDSLANS